MFYREGHAKPAFTMKPLLVMPDLNAAIIRQSQNRIPGMWYFGSYKKAPQSGAFCWGV